MKSFTFKLQALLRIREQVKEECLKAYAQALQKRIMQEQVCKELQEKITMVCNGEKSVKTFGPVERIRIWDALRLMTESLKNEKDLLNRLEKSEEESLTLLLKAKMALEVLKKLREKQEKFFYVSELKAEEKFLNDWVNRAFGLRISKS